jgi:hypothetical protein
MSASEIVEELKHLSNAELLAVIEAANRLIGKEGSDLAGTNLDEDPLLRVAGCLSGEPISATEIEEELYGDKH